MNVLIVDMLDGFAKEGPLSSPRVDALIPKQVAFLNALPDDANVVFLADLHRENDNELKVITPHCVEGTQEAEICSELRKAAKRFDPKIIYKNTFSGFHGNNELLHPLTLRSALGEENDWIVMGCVTDICILANAHELIYRGKGVTLLRDCIDTFDIPGVHNADEINKVFFEQVFPIIGVKVSTSEEILQLQEV